MNNKIIEDSFQAFLVEGAHFTSNEEYPILEDWMISTSPPKEIMPFNKALNFRGDLSDTFICFYSPDKTFERVRRNPQAYVDFFKRTAGIIGFDFSIHSDMPVIKQKSQINDNLSLSYYYGKQGIKIIPNLRCGIDELMPEYFSAIPKNSLIAIGTHGFIKDNVQIAEWYCYIEDVIDKLNPPNIIIYGPLRNKIFDNLKSKTTFLMYDSWISIHRREVLKNVNEGCK